MIKNDSFSLFAVIFIFVCVTATVKMFGCMFVANLSPRFRSSSVDRLRKNDKS